MLSSCILLQNSVSNQQDIQSRTVTFKKNSPKEITQGIFIIVYAALMRTFLSVEYPVSPGAEENQVFLFFLRVRQTFRFFLLQPQFSSDGRRTAQVFFILWCCRHPALAYQSHGSSSQWVQRLPRHHSCIVMLPGP